MTETALLRRQIRLFLWLFIAGLVLSGLTAFPLEWEVRLLDAWVGAVNPPLPGWSSLVAWVGRVHQGVSETYIRYPFIAYGTDWLAFAHVVIAVAFIGPLRHPVRNRWVIEWGLIACALVLPLALICGPLRGIPLFWRAIDCSFGVIGAIPLWLCRRWILRLEALERGTHPLSPG